MRLIKKNNRFILFLILCLSLCRIEASSAKVPQDLNDKSRVTTASPAQKFVSVGSLSRESSVSNPLDVNNKPPTTAPPPPSSGEVVDFCPTLRERSASNPLNASSRKCETRWAERRRLLCAYDHALHKVCAAMQGTWEQREKQDHQKALAQADRIIKDLNEGDDEKRDFSRKAVTPQPRQAFSVPRNNISSAGCNKSRLSLGSLQVGKETNESIVDFSSMSGGNSPIQQVPFLSQPTVPIPCSKKRDLFLEGLEADIKTVPANHNEIEESRNNRSNSVAIQTDPEKVDPTISSLPKEMTLWEHLVELKDDIVLHKKKCFAFVFIPIIFGISMKLYVNELNRDIPKTKKEHVQAYLKKTKDLIFQALKHPRESFRRYPKFTVAAWTVLMTEAALVANAVL